MIDQLKRKVLSGNDITREEAIKLADANLEKLCGAADELRRHYCGNGFDICSVINGKSGKCSENCRYCAQSVWHHVEIEQYPLLSTDKIAKDAQYNCSRGILRYSVVTSGRCLSDAEVEQICDSYRTINQSLPIALCASHGLMNYEQFIKLKSAGVSRYHNNLETSRRYFPSICTTHTYNEKINTIRAAQRAGLTVCSGGIMGLGETMEDRIDMALELRWVGD